MPEPNEIYCSVCYDFHPEGKHLKLDEVEKKHVIGVFEATGRNILQTANILAIARSSLQRKLDQYGMRH